MSYPNMLNCNFRTPPLRIDQYQAMVTHLQVHSTLAHGVVLPPTPGVTANCRERCACRVAGYANGFEDDDASSLRSRSRSRSRRRDRIFRCTDCNDRAYEIEKGLNQHKQRHCGKPREEGVFPCTACNKVFVAAGLLAMHMGRFHTDRSAPRVGGSDDQEISNNRRGESAPISRGNYRRRETSFRESTSSVGEGHGERTVNREEGQGERTVNRD